MNNENALFIVIDCHAAAATWVLLQLLMMVSM
jgi:hypothetical protein